MSYSTKQNVGKITTCGFGGVNLSAPLMKENYGKLIDISNIFLCQTTIYTVLQAW